MREINNQKIVGQATNIVAATILKGNVESNKNFVFSPLGFSSILTILGEGANDDTSLDIAAMLKHPEEKQRVRASYKSVLKSLQGDNPTVAPQFKTWLYVYKNNTIENDYRTTLQESYFVEVKDIEREYYNWNDPKTTTNLETDTKKEETSTQAPNDPNSKDIPEFDTLKKDDEPIDEQRIIDDQKDASKFDEVVEDKQYVEAPFIRESLAKGQTQDTAVEATEPKVSVDQPTKVDLPLKPFEELEIMQAQETKLSRSFRSVSWTPKNSVRSKSHNFRFSSVETKRVTEHR